MNGFEQIGLFYLGREYELETSRRLESLLIYDSRDLVTHGVCIGMTGSGKTGLCLCLLEEAAIDRIPALIIDPKGDLGNLLLCFPDLRPEDFRPWVNPEEAERKGMSLDEYATSVAEKWRAGLSDWGMSPDRIRLLRDSVDFAVYTPGSESGRPVSVLSSLKAPDLSWDENSEIIGEQITGTVSALLQMVGLSADPIRSREHILLSAIFQHFWGTGKDLDMPGLILAVQDPPFQKLGVFDTESFYPKKERFELAVALNTLLASPSFASWMKGEPIDIQRFLYTPEGKPRHSIFYIAHLSDSERMFFVTLLLGQALTWVRRQPGTTSLRALLYFDEVFGYIPPVAEPPSKKPLITLLKQARASGFGVLLATQNPVDLDYKALTNAGTWFIGKLQAERDKARVLDGLVSVAEEKGSTLSRQDMDKIISSLEPRVFLLHDVHREGPAVFQTRWAMSYLRGPLTREEIRRLSGTIAQDAPVAELARQAPRPSGASCTAARPVLSPDIPQVFMPGQGSGLNLVPALLALGTVRFSDHRLGINTSRRVGLLVRPDKIGPVIPWNDAERVEVDPASLSRVPPEGALFAGVPPELSDPKAFSFYSRDFAEYLYREQYLEILHSPILNIYGKPGESEADFRARLDAAARERRDREIDQLRAKYGQRLARLETRLAAEQNELESHKREVEARGREAGLSTAEAVLGGIFGRRRSISSVSRKYRLKEKAEEKLRESYSEITRLTKEIEALKDEIEAEISAIRDRWASTIDQVEKKLIKPKRTDVSVHLVALAWVPADQQAL
ncbi:MAG: ATP-binding protein [candidate division WOR-3 bacterium]